MDSIDALCPWTRRQFGVEGPGEGLVFYPNSNLNIIIGEDTQLMGITLSHFRSLVFKIKGSAHKMTREAKSEKDTDFTNLESYVAHFLVPSRIEQAFSSTLAVELPITESMQARVTAWLVKDILKESKEFTLRGKTPLESEKFTKLISQKVTQYVARV